MPIIDSSPPMVVSSYPFHQEQNVRLDSSIAVQFNEAIKLGNGSILLSNGQGDSRRIALHDSSQVAFYNNTGKFGGTLLGSLTINPHANLLSNSRYFVLVAEGAVTDIAGNPLAAVTDTNSYSFNTSPDTSTPIAMSSIPVNHSDTVSVTGEIIATFNEPVQYAGGGILITDDKESPRQVIASSEENTLVLKWQYPLLPNTEYFLKVPNGAITDVAGNSFAGVQGNEFSFRTGNDDTTAPNLFFNYSSQPVPVTQNIRLFSNELLKAKTGTITLSNGQGDVRKMSVNDSSQVTFELGYSNESWLTINPSENLWPNSQYTVQIDPDAITDLAGNPFVLQYGQEYGASYPHVSTAGLDTTPPTPLVASFISSEYFKGIKHINVLTGIKVCFDEPIITGKGNAVISNGLDDTQTLDFNDPSKDFEFYCLKFKPKQKLLPGNRYHVLVDANMITDLAGNAYAGVQDPNTFTFETESLWAATQNPVMETNRGNSLGVYENNDILTFRFNAPVTSYKSFNLSNHTFGGNDVVLSDDGLSASVELTSDSTVMPGDLVKFEEVKGSTGADGFTPTTDIEFEL